MSDRIYPPVRPRGRRDIILSTTDQDFRSVDDCARAVAAAFGAPADPSIERIRVRRALKDLQRNQLVARTPWGWRCTKAGREHPRAIAVASSPR